MKRVLPRTLGFFLVTLIPVVYLHMVKLPSWAAFMDGLLSSAVFAMPFLLAMWVGIKRIGRNKVGDLPTELIIGAIAAAFMWSLLWAVWSAVPPKYIASAEDWAFYSHLVAALGTGYLCTFFGTEKPERAKSNAPSPSY